VDAHVGEAVAAAGAAAVAAHLGDAAAGARRDCNASIDKQLHAVRRLPVAIPHDENMRAFPRQSKAAGSDVRSLTTPCELGNTPSVPSLAMRRGSGGVPKKGYPRCESVEKKKTASIGRSPWNTLGGNSENFIRPQTRHQGCTLYSQRSVGGRERCAERISVSRMAE
jgi:hypothetical protein